jgi:hypothetical protein
MLFDSTDSERNAKQPNWLKQQLGRLRRIETKDASMNWYRPDARGIFVAAANNKTR